MDLKGKRWSASAGLLTTVAVIIAVARKALGFGKIVTAMAKVVSLCGECEICVRIKNFGWLS
jgi:hypothetical protein